MVSRLEIEADRAAASGNLQAACRSLEEAAAAGGATIDLWMKLSAIRRALGDLEGAIKALDRGLSLSPLDFSALLARATLLERTGSAQAGAAFNKAIAQLPPGEPVPKTMAAAVEHAKMMAAEHQAAVEARFLERVPASLGAGERARVERFVANISRRTRHFHQEPVTFHFPGMPEIEFHDASQFEGIRQLEAATADILAEYEALVKLKTAELVPYSQYPDHVPLAQWKELNNNRDWTAIHLLQNGKRVEANAKHCPKTLELLSRLPQAQIPGASPNAMFSLLAPRTHIPPHTGVANVRLVSHLPLIVPSDCGFRVGATTIEWKVGEAIVFDDTIEHEAWNDSDQLRVVLIFDLWAPSLNPAERDAIARVISSAGVSFKGG